jgi:transcriptional regulator with XRE-family HTH domain
VATVRSPTMPRRRLGIELRDVREAAGKTIEDAAAVLDCSDSKVSRIENGQVGVSLRDVRDLLDDYRVQGERRAEVLELARKAREKAWWQSYGDTPAVAVVGLQTAARRIDTYQDQLVPGLLQTADYSRAVLLALDPTLDEEQVQRSLELRKARRERLFEDREPPKLTAILDEAVLRREVGGPVVMGAQRRHLASAMEGGNVTVRVLPFDAGEHAGLLGSFTIFWLPDERDPDVVLLEQQPRDLYLESPAELRRYSAAFDRLSRKALGPDTSLTFIEALAGDHPAGR